MARNSLRLQIASNNRTLDFSQTGRNTRMMITVAMETKTPTARKITVTKVVSRVSRLLSTL